MDVLTTVLEILGLALLVTCAALVYPPAAFAVAGAGLLWLARGIEKGRAA